MAQIKKIKPFETPLELLKQSFDTYRSKFSTFFIFGLVVFAVTLIQIFSVRARSMPIFIASVVATVIVSYIMYIAMLRVAGETGKSSAWGALVRVEHYIVPSLWVSVAIILVSLGGLLILVIPGVVLSIFVMFSLLAVVIDHYEKTEAIVYSWHLVKERWFGVFVRLLVANIVIGGIALVVMGIFWLFGIGETPLETISRAKVGDFSVSVSQTIMSEIIGNFFILPLAIIFIAKLYEALKRTTTYVVTEAEMVKTMKYVRIFAILGVVFVVGCFFISSIKLAQIVPQFIRLTHAPASVFSAF